MTLEEKIGQLLVIGINGDRTVDQDTRQLIGKLHIGGVILFKDNLSGGLVTSVRLINSLKSVNMNARNPAPLLISVDQEGGRVSRLPKEFEPMPAAAVVGKSGDAKLAREMGELIGKQLRLLGINMDFAPVLDINSNPKNPVIGDRAFGTDAKTVTRMGVAAMQGIGDTSVVPVVKHFPGHGDTAVDSHKDLPVVNKTASQLEKLEWIPFRAAVRDGAEAVMVAHILYPKLDPDFPASISHVLITDQLRGKLGFDGVVITDDLTMGAIVKNYGIADAAVRAVKAGSDLALVAHGYDTARDVYDALLKNVKSGRISESRIDESVYRILRLKRQSGLTDIAVAVPKLSDLPNDAVKRWRDSLSR